MPQPLHRSILANGITAIAIENPTADIVAGRIFFKQAGTRVESLDKAGLSHLVSAVLTKGTERLSAAEIADRVESVGAGLGTDAAADYFALNLKTVSGDFESILELAGEILRSPSFPEREVELERHLTLQAIRSEREQPFNLALKQLRAQMYPNAPYGISGLGTEATVEHLTRDDLQTYHRTYFRPDNVVISLSGNLDRAAAVAAIERVFGDWRIPKTPLPAADFPSCQPQPQRQATPQQTQQAIVMLGYLAASVRQEDYPTLKLLNTYLGNGLSSRLFVELREKRGLAYEVSAFYPTRLEPSHFVTYMGTAPENTPTAIAGLRAEVSRLCENAIAPDEWQAAKNKLLGQYALGKQSNAQLSQLYGWYETLGLGVEFDTSFQDAIAAVTPTLARDAAQRYFAIEPYISLVGPEAAIG